MAGLPLDIVLRIAENCDWCWADLPIPNADNDDMAIDADSTEAAAGGSGSLGRGSADEGRKPRLLVWSEWWQPRCIRITRLLLLLGVKLLVAMTVMNHGPLSAPVTTTTWVTRSSGSLTQLVPTLA